ncbi:hypothetical protein AB6A40_007830 [Gnathostoma spinigerum]|uniref:Uncharacterized protein n=1 Tax=Gnathostoma spinigerum TaxID=75299 RepID=A0ABD6EPC6_9BILA
MPIRSRHVIKDALIFARGEKFAPCPPGVENLVEYAPCNTHKCPVNLSTYKWSECFHTTHQWINHTWVQNETCYRVRDIPADDQLIYIDTSEIIRTQKCNPLCF